MALYKFNNFVFDSSSHRLTYRGAKVAVRPKALKLLNLLILNRHRLVSKAEIMEAIWGSNYARDHLLFQLISEIRRLSADFELVRTQPNEGYQWVVPTNIVQHERFVPRSIAASIFLGLTCLLISLNLDTKDERTANLSVLPAYSALSKGIVALENGEQDHAIEWFEYALRENPESVEPSLFLAETLHQQNRPEESSAHLEALLKRPGLGAYNKITATDLLSRIRQRQGRLQDALDYAQISNQVEIMGQCSIEAVEQRVQMLEDKLGSKLAMSPNYQQQKTDVAKTDSYQVTGDQERCEQLEQPSAETASCTPILSEQHYVIARAHRFFNIS